MATEEHHIPDDGEPHTTLGYCWCSPGVAGRGPRLTVWTHVTPAAATPPATVPLYDRTAVTADDLPVTEP